MNIGSRPLLLISMQGGLVLLVLSLTGAVFSMENECAVGQTYIEKRYFGGPYWSRKTHLVTSPENATVQKVGSRQCGFEFIARAFEIAPQGNFFDDDCPAVVIKYTSVDLPHRKGSYCSVWDKRVVCVCDYYKCNTLHNSLVDIILRAFRMRSEDEEIPGLSKTDLRQYYESNRDEVLFPCLVEIVLQAYGLTLGDFTIDGKTRFRLGLKYGENGDDRTWLRADPRYGLDPNTVKQLKEKDQLIWPGKAEVKC